jgi:hypothetical protein
MNNLGDFYRRHKIFLTRIFPAIIAGIVVLFFAIRIVHDDKQKEQEALFYSLDSLIQHKEDIVSVKEKRIALIKEQRKFSHSLADQYMLDQMLYKEYQVYNADSALIYINHGIEIAQRTGNKEWLASSIIDQSFVYTAIGLLKEALEAMKSIQSNTLNNSLRSKYYGQMSTLYSRLCLYTKDNPSMWKIYNQKRDSYVDSICMIPLMKQPRYLFNMIWRNIDSPVSLKYKRALIAMIKRTSPDTRRYAMLTSTQAAIYKREKNDNEYIRYLIASAKADILCLNGDVSSLQDLASYLFEHNDLDRAYFYVNFCSQTARNFGNRVRYIDVSKLQDMIYQSYQKRNIVQERHLRLYSILVSLLTIFLVAAFIVIRRQMKKLSISSKQLDNANKQLITNMEKISEAHERLAEVNMQLNSVNKELQDLNVQLRESNYVKEEYIGYVFNICSNYIDKLENYRKEIHRKLKVGQTEDVYKMTSPSKAVDDDIHELYNQFDTIFLHIYPDFIEDINALLIPEERIIPKEGELLNTELRIQALYRLGIIDSVKIASFLHCSVQTVYNNRQITRNKASISKEDFDVAVKRLGKTQI